MTGFDNCISLIYSYILKMELQGGKVKTLSEKRSGRFPEEPLSLKTGFGAGSGLVMKSETFMELGSPSQGSCAFAVYSNGNALIRDGRIRLIGPDVSECRGAALPFGQVILADGKELSEEDYILLHKCQYTGDRIEGYMVKSTPGNIWTRVSLDSAAKGFNFEFLGNSLINLVKERIPRALSVEVLFITSDKADLLPLIKISEEVKKLYQDIKEKRWKKRGVDIYECAFHGNCSECGDKELCLEVNKISKIRKELSMKTEGEQHEL
jgi:CO dehydrogenase/acetyl-CoA synthase beta subunit